MLDLIDQLLARIALGEGVALCTLVRARGSTPQAAGAAMAVFENGQTLGTLGGGCVEAEVRVRALRSIPAHASHLVSFKLDHDFGWDDGLMCGGMMDVAIQVFTTVADIEPLIRVREALSKKTAATYEVAVPDAEGTVHAFSVAFTPRPTLLIAGAGHVGQAIASLAATLDFDVVTVDDRGDVLSEQRFPRSARIIGDIDAELRRFPIDPNTYIVIVTRGHRNDAGALGAVIRSPAAYIGMIGSKRKVRTILEGLVRDGGIERELLYRVRAPIGLEIGAVTPAEIAVSIAAELISVRRGRGNEPAASLQMPREELNRWLDR